MPKIIRILRLCYMKIFSKCPTVNISKLNFWLLICIAKNVIWTTLKMIFSIFRFFFCTLRFQIFKYCPIITNGSLFMMCKSQFKMTGFVVQGKNAVLIQWVCWMHAGADMPVLLLRGWRSAVPVDGEGEALTQRERLVVWAWWSAGSCVWCSSAGVGLCSDEGSDSDRSLWLQCSRI